jgi:hypothetical protein
MQALANPGIVRGAVALPRTSGRGGKGSLFERGAYLIACGLIGEPVPPVMISGEPQKKNS